MSFDKLPPGVKPDDVYEEEEDLCDRCHEDPCKCDGGERL